MNLDEVKVVRMDWTNLNDESKKPKSIKSKIECLIKKENDEIDEYRDQHPTFQDLLEAIGYEGLEIVENKICYLNDIEPPDFVFNLANRPDIPFY